MSSRETKDNIPTKLLASLANEANEKMQTNKHILETIQIYQNQIKIIKQILTNNKEDNKNIEQKQEDKNGIPQNIEEIKENKEEPLRTEETPNENKEEKNQKNTLFNNKLQNTLNCLNQSAGGKNAMNEEELKQNLFNQTSQEFLKKFLMFV